MFSLENQSEAMELLRNKLDLSQDNTSAFTEALVRIVPKDIDEEKKEFCRLLIHSIEKVLDTHSEYASLGVDLVLKLAEETGHPPKKIITSIKRNGSKLKLPTLSWVNKNLRIADVIAERPALGEISSIDKIDSLRRLPKEQLDLVCEEGVFVTTTGENLDVKKTPAHEVRKAVAQVVKQEKAAASQAKESESMTVEASSSQKTVVQTVTEEYPELQAMLRLHRQLAKRVSDDSAMFNEDLIFRFDKLGSDLEAFIAAIKGEEQNAEIRSGENSDIAVN